MYIYSLQIQVLSMSATQCRGNYRIFQFASAIRQQKTTKESAEIFVYYSSNGLAYFAKGNDLVF